MQGDNTEHMTNISAALPRAAVMCVNREKVFILIASFQKKKKKKKFF